MSRCEVLVLSLLALVVVGIYSNTLHAPFVFDDYSSIRNNAAIQLTTFTLKDITKAGSEAYRTRRPVAYMSFAMARSCPSSVPVHEHSQRGALEGGEQ